MQNFKKKTNIIKIFFFLPCSLSDPFSEDDASDEWKKDLRAGDMSIYISI